MADPMLGAGVPGLLDMIDAPHNAGGWAANLAAAGTGPLGLDPMFAGPGGSYNEPNYLAQVLANAARSNVNTAARDRENPGQAQFGTWAQGDPAERAAWSNRNTANFSTFPGTEQYFDANGSPRADDPRQVASDAGISPQQLAAGLLPRYGNRYGRSGQAAQGYDFPSDKGGFFRMSDLYQNYPSGVPQAASLSQGGLSTNNWRLLGQGPGYIMRNGQLIDTRSGGGAWGGPAGWTPNMGNTGEQSQQAVGIALGTGTPYGVPNMHQAGLGFPVSIGWPGAASGWTRVGGPSEG